MPNPKPRRAAKRQPAKPAKPTDRFPFETEYLNGIILPRLAALIQANQPTSIKQLLNLIQSNYPLTAQPSHNLLSRWLRALNISPQRTTTFNLPTDGPAGPPRPGSFRAEPRGTHPPATYLPPDDDRLLIADNERTDRPLPEPYPDPTLHQPPTQRIPGGLLQLLHAPDPGTAQAPFIPPPS